MTYGFIGLGNMASAIIRGMYNNGFFTVHSVCGHNRSREKTDILAEETGLIPCDSNIEVVSKSDVIVLAVKPQFMEDVLNEIAPAVTPDKLYITVAAGKTLEWYAPFLKHCPIVRTMPNINSVVGMSATAITPNDFVTKNQLSIAEEMFSAVGEVYPISEKLFSAFSALCGSSVAFTFMYMDALASAGVKAGFPKKQALEFAMQSVAGCAVMLSASGKSPSELVDMICSPGGTTIEGVHKIRELGFENAVYKGIDAIIEKDKKI